MIHYTTIKQSKELLRLGLSPESADMYYNLDNSKIPNIIIGAKDDFRCYIPCWSLGALFEVMPKDIKIYTQSKDKFNPCIRYQGDGIYSCVYVNTNFSGSWEMSVGKNSIEAAYNMVVWLLENGYIKKEE